MITRRLFTALLAAAPLAADATRVVFRFEFVNGDMRTSFEIVSFDPVMEFLTVRKKV